MFKSTLIHGIKALAEQGIRLKARGVYDSPFQRFLVDAALFPLDALAAQGALKNSGASRSNLVWPRTFNAKLMFGKLFRRKSIHIQWADKLAVRDYVRDTIGEQYLTKLYWSGTDLSAVDPERLPETFVIKANHSSGQNLIVQSKKDFDWAAAVQTCREWLEYDHSIGNGEWQYRWIKPQIFIEEFLEGKDGNPPLDFKFFCFHGKMSFVQVDFDRFTNHTRTLFDPGFQPLPFGILYEINRKQIPKPDCLEEMIIVVEKLSQGEPFLRVDFYEINKRPVFGELTLHPGSGGENFIPAEWDYKIGALM